MLDADEFQTAPRILPETGRTPASGCRDRQEGRLCVFVADSVLDGFSAFARIPQHIILLERQGEFRRHEHRKAGASVVDWNGIDAVGNAVT
jgi:hypothetical protein